MFLISRKAFAFLPVLAEKSLHLPPPPTLCSKLLLRKEAKMGWGGMGGGEGGSEVFFSSLSLQSPA